MRTVTILFLYTVGIFIFSIKYSSADISDYMTGLKAYSDGFYDVAAISFEDYLASAYDNKAAAYSKYLLYKIYLDKKDYKKAQSRLSEIDNITDERFDINAMAYDTILINSQLDCSKGLQLLADPKYSEYQDAFFISDCPLTQKEILSLGINNLSLTMRYNIIFKIKDDVSFTSKLFKSLDLSQFSKEELKKLGIFLYEKKLFDEFWSLYKSFRDDDIINLGLERLWDVKHYDSFLKSFEANTSYKINSTNYCRAVFSYNKLSKQFDCGILDKCYEDKSEKYVESKIACLSSVHNKDGLNSFIESLDEDSFQSVCAFGLFLSENDLLSPDSISRFSICKERQEIAEYYLIQKKYDFIKILIPSPLSDKDYSLLTKGYIGAKDYAKASAAVKNIKSKAIKSTLEKEVEAIKPKQTNKKTGKKKK